MDNVIIESDKDKVCLRTNELPLGLRALFWLFLIFAVSVGAMNTGLLRLPFVIIMGLMGCYFVIGSLEDVVVKINKHSGDVYVDRVSVFGVKRAQYYVDEVSIIESQEMSVDKVDDRSGRGHTSRVLRFSHPESGNDLVLAYTSNFIRFDERRVEVKKAFGDKLIKKIYQTESFSD